MNHESDKRERPEGTGRQDSQHNQRNQHTPQGPHVQVSIDEMLGRLDKVRKCGRGWIARCPSHEDKTASLSICEGDNCILVHCFALCSTADVLAAVGLQLADLFPTPPKPATPQARAAARQYARESRIVAAVGVLDTESGVVLCAAGTLARSEKLSEADHERLTLACQRITDAREVLHGR